MVQAIKIIGWLMVAGVLMMAYLFISQYLVSERDFVPTSGLLMEDVTITQDVEREVDISLRLKLEGEPGKTYGLPGKLLALARPEIYQLKKGTEVQLYIKKADKKNEVEKSMQHLERIWGIGTVGEAPYLELKDAISYTREPRSLIYAVCFVFMALLIVVYLLRK